MKGEVELTREALVALRAERLAALLLEHAADDERLEERLRLALAARWDEGSVVRLLRGRIGELECGRGFVERYEAPGLAGEIDDICAAVTDGVMPKAPRAAAELMGALVD